ncbi:hypothetical protein Scani_40830 [Streptomyces caniferus]|uniref:Uncharacterized protein n=1 Tax=Streptomyces caniferus TaxID=285557 RepID=A0A640SE07_9ACTN|nr:hypothetical protein Scani_40830 [Streptomyces caniferus]
MHFRIVPVRPRPARGVAAAGLLVAASVVYNDWMLQLFLPTGLLQRDSYVSELFAADQPYQLLPTRRPGSEFGAPMGTLAVGGLHGGRHLHRRAVLRAPGRARPGAAHPSGLGGGVVRAVGQGGERSLRTG